MDIDAWYEFALGLPKVQLADARQVDSCLLEGVQRNRLDQLIQGMAAHTRVSVMTNLNLRNRLLAQTRPNFADIFAKAGPDSEPKLGCHNDGSHYRQLRKWTVSPVKF